MLFGAFFNGDNRYLPVTALEGSVVVQDLAGNYAFSNTSATSGSGPQSIGGTLPELGPSIARPSRSCRSEQARPRCESPCPAGSVCGVAGTCVEVIAELWLRDFGSSGGPATAQTDWWRSNLGIGANPVRRSIGGLGFFKVPRTLSHCLLSRKGSREPHFCS